MKSSVMVCTLFVVLLCSAAQAALLDKLKDAAESVARDVTVDAPAQQNSGAQDSSGTAPIAAAASSGAVGAGKRTGVLSESFVLDRTERDIRPL